MSFPKRCACCQREYTPATWAHLRYVGPMCLDPGDDLELRDCHCGNTLAIAVVDPCAETIPAPAA